MNAQSTANLLAETIHDVNDPTRNRVHTLKIHRTKTNNEKKRNIVKPIESKNESLFSENSRNTTHCRCVVCTLIFDDVINSTLHTKLKPS